MGPPLWTIRDPMIRAIVGARRRQAEAAQHAQVSRHVPTPAPRVQTPVMTDYYHAALMTMSKANCLAVLARLDQRPPPTTRVADLRLAISRALLTGGQAQSDAERAIRHCPIKLHAGMTIRLLRDLDPETPFIWRVYKPYINDQDRVFLNFSRYVVQGLIVGAKRPTVHLFDLDHTVTVEFLNSMMDARYHEGAWDEKKGLDFTVKELQESAPSERRHGKCVLTWQQRALTRDERAAVKRDGLLNLSDWATAWGTPVPV